MQLRFCESEISYWANRYMGHHSQRQQAAEQELIDLENEVKGRGYLTKEELHKIAHWKAHRLAHLTLGNTDDCIKKVTAQAFASTDDWTKLQTLTELKGVREPITSAILHFYDKDPYPILARPALWSAGMESKERTSYPFWIEYVQFCREIANRNSVTMRELDRALWKFAADKEKAERCA